MLIQTRIRNRRGAVLMKLAVSLTVLTGMLALNLDGGRMMEERRKAQAAADAAALAAAADLYTNTWDCQGVDTKGSAKAAAIAIAAANGYPSSAVTVNIPPTSGTYAGQAGHVEVIVDSKPSASFGRAFTGDTMRVTARTVARGEPMKIGIILLRATGSGSFDNSAAVFGLVNKPLIVNSNDPAALQTSSLVFLGLNRIDVTGGYTNAGLLTLSFPIHTGVRPTPDPLALLPIPSTGGVPVRSATPLTINSLLPTVLQPGVYQGGIRVTGASIVLMNPGTYIMEGGGFRVDGLATVTGLNVFIYNTTSGTYSSGPISVSGVGKVVLTAPLSGTYQGINFFQNRAMTNAVSITGLGLTTITGVVYAAKAPVNLTGSAAVGLDILGGAYVCDSMKVTGIGAVTINLGLNPPRVPDVHVVE